jgi:hypothetical protein
MASINAKLRVRREKDSVDERFGHANKARISKAHRQVGIFLHEREDTFHLVAQVENGQHRAAAEQCNECWGTARTNKMKGLRQSRIAGLPWRREALCLRGSPAVIGITATQKSDQKAGINENVSGHTP